MFLCVPIAKGGIWDPFELREEFPPERHAIVLANSYLEGFPSMFCGRLPDFKLELESSISHFPEPWIKAHQSFGPLFKMLEGFAQIEINLGQRPAASNCNLK